MHPIPLNVDSIGDEFSARMEPAVPLPIDGFAFLANSPTAAHADFAVVQATPQLILDINLGRP